MKLIGSYTSPFVRKISVILLEKAIPFEFVNEFPYNDVNGVAQYNPLGKVPAMLPAEPLAALKMRQLEALSDGIMEAAIALVREKARPAAQQSETELLRQREKIARGLDMLEGYAADGTLRHGELNLATITAACAIAYLNFRRVAPGWCAMRPKLVKLVETLFQRASFARTEPPGS
ncbi:TPA: glutathione S-transferase [Klebsiella aerogenes]